MSCSRIIGMFFACVSVALALVSLVSDFWMINDSSHLHLGLWHGCRNGQCFDVVSGTVMFLTVGVVVYTGKTIEAIKMERSMLAYGWSFYLGWVAFPLLCFTVLLHYLAYRSTPAIGYEQV